MAEQQLTTKTGRSRPVEGLPAADAPGSRSRRRSGKGLRGRLARRQERAAYAFLSPWLIGLVLFWLGPIVASVLLSFTDWSLLGDSHWIGLDNYRELAGDFNFRQSLKVTSIYTALSVPLYMAAGLGLSLLLNLRLRGMNVFRTILFVPSVLSGVAVAILWASLLNPDTGAVNWILQSLGVNHPPRWLGSPTWAVPAVVLIGLWGVGGGAIIYLAGLQNIPVQLYEAARVDGAGAWERFRFVTWPMITPTMLFVLLTSLIQAFQVFDIAYVLGGTHGGTGGSLRFYLINMWSEGFSQGRMGYAAALAWVLVMIAGVVIISIFKTSGRWVYYEHDPDRS